MPTTFWATGTFERRRRLALVAVIAAVPTAAPAGQAVDMALVVDEFLALCASAKPVASGDITPAFEARGWRRTRRLARDLLPVVMRRSATEIADWPDLFPDSPGLAGWTFPLDEGRTARAVVAAGETAGEIGPAQEFRCALAVALAPARLTIRSLLVDRLGADAATPATPFHCRDCKVQQWRAKGVIVQHWQVGPTNYLFASRAPGT